jgi:hypothetical protein
MTAKELRANIGNVIEWEHSHCRHRGVCLVAKGVIEDVYGKSVKVNGDWKWHPHMINAKIIDSVE